MKDIKKSSAEERVINKYLHKLSIGLKDNKELYGIALSFAKILLEERNWKLVPACTVDGADEYSHTQGEVAYVYLKKEYSRSIHVEG